MAEFIQLHLPVFIVLILSWVGFGLWISRSNKKSYQFKLYIVPNEKGSGVDGLESSKKPQIKDLARKQVKDSARKHNVSESKLIDGYVALGFVVDRYMGPNSQLVIQNSTDGGADIIIPLDELIR